MDHYTEIVHLKDRMAALEREVERVHRSLSSLRGITLALVINVVVFVGWLTLRQMPS